MPSMMCVTEAKLFVWLPTSAIITPMQAGNIRWLIVITYLVPDAFLCQHLTEQFTLLHTGSTNKHWPPLTVDTFDLSHNSLPLVLLKPVKRLSEHRSHTSGVAAYCSTEVHAVLASARRTPQD